MNLQELILKIRNSISPQEKLSNEAVLGFLRVLEKADGEEIDCDQLFKTLDEYVEREVNKKDAARLMPLVREHLDSCSECCEEYEALLNVIEKTEEK